MSLNQRQNIFIFILAVIRIQEDILNGEYIIARYSKLVCMYINVYIYIKILVALSIYYTEKISNLQVDLRMAFATIF